MFRNLFSKSRLIVICSIIVLACADAALAHPLGNFTINQFARLHIADQRLDVHCVVDMAEIPAFQEMQIIDTDGDGQASEAELSAYGEHQATEYLKGLLITVDGDPVTLQPLATTVTRPAGAGGLTTLRLEMDYSGAVASNVAGASHRLVFDSSNYSSRLGWREIEVGSESGLAVFNSSAYGSGVTNELRNYPDNLLASPLNERKAELSFTRGAMPAGSTALKMRDGNPVQQSSDRLASLIAVPNLTLGVALFGLLIAAVLGSLHALSPGHGKTIVGAYLVGARGTVRHAAFLGLTVTITHTLGVFALGLVTLFASRYVVPDRLFPIISIVSGAIVFFIGGSLFLKRLRPLLAHRSSGHLHAQHAHAHGSSHEHADHSHSGHSHDHTHDQAHDHSHDHAAVDGAFVHSHGGVTHSHMPPGADGGRITWRSLLALGISGGLLPCPSALVVLLSAISLHRIGYGLLLVITFSLGLATTLTAVGLLFLYAGRLMKGRLGKGRWVQVLPVMSALVITCAGAAICYEAVVQAGVNIPAFFKSIAGWFNGTMPQANTVSTATLLALGLVFGLKHAMEADHVAAVTTIASEKKSILSSSIVGGLWGLGHTISLLIAGLAVLVLHVRIEGRTALALEFCVALMLIVLGVNAIRKLLRGGKLHIHPHQHGHHAHAHPHIHDESEAAVPHSHHGIRLSMRPLVVGMIHGMAGSAALMLLVLSTISSTWVGLSYIAVFGIGSIGGMLIMSALISLPVHLTAARFNRVNFAFRMLAGVFSLGFGVFMVYEIGFVSHLFV